MLREAGNRQCSVITKERQAREVMHNLKRTVAPGKRSQGVVKFFFSHPAFLKFHGREGNRTKEDAVVD